MKTTLLTKLVVPAILIGSFVFLGNAIEPEKKDKTSSDKAVKTTATSVRNASSTDYLKFIMPKAFQAVKQTATYRKDANGIYRLVANEGC
jgi:hypothetical protein